MMSTSSYLSASSAGEGKQPHSAYTGQGRFYSYPAALTCICTGTFCQTGIMNLTELSPTAFTSRNQAQVFPPITVALLCTSGML